MFAKISGTGSYLPKSVLHNHDLEKMLPTSDEWIMKRAGIKQRHIANESETTSFMGLQAARNAISAANIQANNIDLIIVATGTPDYIMPSTATIVQDMLEISDCIAFDVNAACSGFIHAVDIAKQYIENSNCNNALVVASERMSRILNWKDRSTCVLFGDGAGAIILSKSQTPGLLVSSLHTQGNLSQGSGKDILRVDTFLPEIPFKKKGRDAVLYMDGKKVFKEAISKLTTLSNSLLKKAELTPADIDWLIPHQANYRILEAIAIKINIPINKIIITLAKHGNTSAASIPLAIDYAIKNKMLKKNQVILAEAFGAGIVWGGFIAKI